MKILIIKSVFVIALMLLITPLNAQSLKPLSQAKRDSILISIAKKVLQKEANQSVFIILLSSPKTNL